MVLKDFEERDNYDSLTKNGVAVANFHASWCGPCLRAGEAFARLSKEYPTMMFLRINTEDFSELGTTEEICVMPTFKLYLNGRQVDKITGYDVERLEKAVRELAEKGSCQKVEAA